MRRLYFALLMGVLLACAKKSPPGTFDLDVGGPLVEARAIRAIQKEVLAIHNISKKDGPREFVWGYDFERWGWGEATLTNLSHSGPHVWKFTLADPIQRPCDAAFLGDRLVPIQSTTWRIEGGPLAGELVRRRAGTRCSIEIASSEWASREHW
jgi:hypothetical protein